MSGERTRSAPLPPRWFIRLAWKGHRALYRVTRGRAGLWPPKPDRWGTMRLTTIGRRTGRERGVILAYFRDGQDLVTLAMNGWAEPEPAWWLNLQAHPGASVTLVDGRGRVEWAVIAEALLLLASSLSQAEQAMAGLRSMRSACEPASA